MMEHTLTLDADVLVIGRGLAGLRAAAEAAQTGGRVVLAHKGGACASNEVMGFNAPVNPGDTVALFYDDIMKSGIGISRTTLARQLAEGSLDEVSAMKAFGLQFDYNPDGTYNAMRALGCTLPRLIHSSSRCGTVAMALLERVCISYGVHFVTDTTITDLLSDNGRAYGAVGYTGAPGREVPAVFRAGAVVLASGGNGGMFPLSTYPDTINGDSYAIAYRAGAVLTDMEFMQFEPCCAVYPEGARGLILVTTMMSEGARLRNAAGQYFLEDAAGAVKSTQKAELSRILAREISAGRGTSHGGVYFDAHAIPRQRLVNDYALFYEPLLHQGVDITQEPAQVAPVAHTNMGGALITPDAATSVAGLFAAGEASGGLHGANRLGGNAGAETIVFGAIAGRSAARYAAQANLPAGSELASALLHNLESRIGDTNAAEPVLPLYNELRASIGKGLGIFRSAQALSRLAEELDGYEKRLGALRVGSRSARTLLCRCENIALSARMQVCASLLRQESRGVFYRDDFPQQNDEVWKKNINLSRYGNTMQATVVDCT